jgi:hypothetical protein
MDRLHPPANKRSRSDTTGEQDAFRARSRSRNRETQEEAESTSIRLSAKNKNWGRDDSSYVRKNVKMRVRNMAFCYECEGEFLIRDFQKLKGGEETPPLECPTCGHLVTVCVDCLARLR